MREHEKGGFIYLKIRKAIYGLPQAGILANKLLRKRLAPAGYYEVAHTPGLWRHVTRPISFSLVVDDFGVKYVGKQHVEHLIKTLRDATYQLETDWEGTLYCGITLEWDYINRTLDISMPGYVAKLRLKFKHIAPKRPQHSIPLTTTMENTSMLCASPSFNKSLVAPSIMGERSTARPSPPSVQSPATKTTLLKTQKHMQHNCWIIWLQIQMRKYDSKHQK